ELITFLKTGSDAACATKVTVDGRLNDIYAGSLSRHPWMFLRRTESGVSLSTTVLPQTMEAIVMPATMAHAKFHGGITAATLNGMYIRMSCSPGSWTGVSAGALAPSGSGAQP